MKIDSLWIALAAGSALALSACVTSSDGEIEKEPVGSYDNGPTLSAAERQECKADGGSIHRRGLLNREMCVFPYSDAGKSCTDSAQCEGQCVSFDGGNWASGSPASGQCQADNAQFGCFAVLKEGKVEHALCVD